MIYTLIIDTSTERGIVVLAKGHEVCFREELPFGLESSKFVMEAIKKGFSALNITPTQLKSVAISSGPGSFTGIRVGASLAKGICIARKIPLISLGSLESLICDEEGEFVSLIDAKINSAYVLLQKKEGGKVICLSETRIIPLSGLTDFISEKYFIVTPAPGRLKSALPSSLKWIEKAPDSQHLATMAEEAFLRGAFSLSGECQLNYINTFRVCSQTRK